MRFVVPIGILAATLLATPAWAGSISLTTTYSSTGSHSCGSSSTSGTLTETCGAAAGLSGLTFGHFNGTGEASISTAGLLSFHAASDLSVWVDNLAGTPGMLSSPYGATLVSRALLEDSVAVNNAGTATAGFLQFEFDITGGVAVTKDVNTLDGFNANLPGTTFINGQGTGSAFLSISGVTTTITGGGTVVLLVPFDFLGFHPLSLTFGTSATGQIFSTYQGVRIDSDFANTAVLVGTTILDADGQVIQGATLASESNFDYRTGSAVVPEPASVLLIALGLGVLVIRRASTPR